MSLYRHLSWLRNQTHGCQGCGFSTKTKLVFDRHIKRCVFHKRRTTSVAPNLEKKKYMTVHEENAEDSSRKQFQNAMGMRSPHQDESVNCGGPSLFPASDACENTKNECKIQGAAKKKKHGYNGNTVNSGNAHKRRYRNYRCKECGFLSNQSREFLCHRVQQHQEKLHIHTCDYCDYASKTKHKLIRHRRLIHEHVTDARSRDANYAIENKTLRQESPGQRDTIFPETEDNNNELGSFYTFEQKQEQLGNFSKTLPSSTSNSSYQDGDILRSALSGNKLTSTSQNVTDNIPSWNIPIELPPDSDSSQEKISFGHGYEIEDSVKLSGADTFDETDQEVADINANATKSTCKQNDLSSMIGATSEGMQKKKVSQIFPGATNVFDFINEGGSVNLSQGPKKRGRKAKNAASVPAMVNTAIPSGGMALCSKSGSVTEETVRRYMKVLPGMGADPVYGCSLCRFTQPSRLKVEYHIRQLHLRAAIFKCPHCDFACKRKTEWIAHKVSHSKKRIHACIECGYQTTFFRNFERHRHHHNAKGGPVKCKYCSYRSTGEAAVQRHMTEYHQSDTKLREHAEAKALLKGHTSDLNPTKDVDGYKSLSDDEDLSQVKLPFQMSEIPVNPFIKDSTGRRRSRDSEGKQSEVGVRCNICGYSAKTEPQLLRHIVVHSKEAPFKCTLCGLRYKRAPDLNRHTRNKHGIANGLNGTPQNSKELGEFSPSPGGNISGMELGSMEGSDTDIEQSEPLNLSIKKNDDSPMALTSVEGTSVTKVLFKPENLKCNYCSYNAKWPSDLRRHKLIHSIEKRFKCTLCPKKFKFQGDVNKHMRAIHHVPVGKPRPRQKKHACDQCNFAATSMGDLSKHKLLHRAKQPWACLFCTVKCFRRQDMAEHLDQHHPSEVEMYGDLHQLVDQTFCLVSGNCSLNSPTPFLQNSKAKSAIEQEVGAVAVAGGTKRGKFKCPSCSYETDTKNKITTHMEVHGNLKRFMCPECGKRSNWIWDVRKHVRKEHPKCTQDVIQMSEEEAMNSLKDYLESTSKRCRTPKELPEKLLTVKRRSSSSSSKSQAETLQKRSQVKVKQEKPDEFDDLQSVQTKNFPMFDHLDDTTPPPGDKLRPFKCSNCGRRSNWKWDLRKHIRTHCPGAQVIVLNAEEAKATINEAVMRSPPKGLDKGGKMQFQKKSIPNAKKLAAEKFRPFKCSACGKRSNWKWDLNKHLRLVHPGGGAHLVILTEREAKKSVKPPTRVKSVKQEPLDETEEPLYQAVHNSKPGLQESVGEGVTDPVSVDRLRLKRFRCSVCNYRSNFKGDIKRHLERQHGDSPEARITVMPLVEAEQTLAHYNAKFSGKRRSFVGGGGMTKARPKSHSLPAPLSGVDLLNMRSFTPDTSSVKTEDDVGMVSRPDSASSGAAASSTPPKRTINTYQCKNCVFWCTSRRAMEDHCRVHSSGDLYQCNLCGDKSDYKNSMYRHIRSRHNTTDMSNIITTKELFTIVGSDDVSADLDTTQDSISMDTSADDQPVGFLIPVYKCKVCGPLRSSIHKYSVIRHFKKRHPDMNPNDYDSFIERCETLKGSLPGTPSPTRAVIGKPINVVQRTFITPKRHRCTICPYRSSKKGLLQLHMSYHKPQPGNNLRCRHCPYYVSLSRMLHSHIRLHLEDQGLLDKTDEPPKPSKPASPPKKPSTNVKDKSGRSSLPCPKCPFITFNKNDFIYHKQFHRPLPNAPHKCDMCPYWAKERRILQLHKKVHESDYLTKRFAFIKGSKKTHSPMKQQLHTSKEKNKHVSPCKSEMSEMSTDDAIEIANIKQQIIASKFKSVAVTPMKVKVSPGFLHSGKDTLSSYVVEKNSMAIGSYKKYYKCRHCPWTNVRSRNLKLHEKMHGARRGHTGKLYQCRYCDYSAGNKGLLTHHVKVHSAQYRPGQDFVNDVEEDDGLFTRSGNDSTTEASDDPEMDASKEGILSKVDAEETSKRLISDGEQKLETDSFPEKSDYYIKYNDSRHQHILERAVMKKWCCEKCPYATMKKSQFERHTQLHGSHQRYTCQYCDYSVPGYHLLLQHEKLHRLPNPNLLCIQSIANLMRLPEIPADIAAATGYNFDDHVLDETLNKAMYENSVDFTEPKRLYRCDRCPYSNSRRDHILAHLKFHMIRSEFRCPHCDYSVSKSHLLGQHIKIHFALPGSEMSCELPGVDDEWEIPKINTANGDVELADVATENTGKVIGKVEVFEDENDNMTKVVDNDMVTDDKENGGKSDMKAENDTKTSDETNSMKVNVEEEDSPDTMWICQYCDRGFHSSLKLQNHEKLHLAGIVSQR